MCMSINVIIQDGYYVLGWIMDWDDFLVLFIFIFCYYQWVLVFDYWVYENFYVIIGGGLIIEW